MNEQQRPIQDQPRVEQGTVAAPQTADVAQTPPVGGTAASVQTGEIDRAESGFLPDDRMGSLRERWNDVQAGFVDDPRNAVQQAHGLVTELVDDLVQTFTRERTALEQQWSAGGDADTEQLRVALQRYRSFFNRLLGT
jgi:hypothetical protein